LKSRALLGIEIIRTVEQHDRLEMAGVEQLERPLAETVMRLKGGFVTTVDPRVAAGGGAPLRKSSRTFPRR
jgi:hypothetical protein